MRKLVAATILALSLGMAGASLASAGGLAIVSGPRSEGLWTDLTIDVTAPAVVVSVEGPISAPTDPCAFCQPTPPPIVPPNPTHLVLVQD